ncbi:MAG: hypothetical protein ACYDGM_09170 [Vulcanimicrobiaceae bacterium]
MMDANSPVAEALIGVRAQLRDAERDVAYANSGHLQRSADAAMAKAAQAALFSEALLQSVHARLAELKAVAKP